MVFQERMVYRTGKNGLQQNALYRGRRLLGVRIYSYLEHQLVSYQANGVSGAHGLSHLEVRTPNRTPCTVAIDS